MTRAVVLLVVQLGCWSKPDAPAEPIAGPMPVRIANANKHDGMASAMSFQLTIPPAENRFLVVSVAMSAGGTIPAVTSISYNMVPLTRLVEITGVPANAKARSEQWQLVAPPVGTSDVVITLVTAALTIHGNAIAYSGVNQTDPVRDTGAMSGADVTSSVVLTSAFNDLVENTIATGGGITAPTIGQTEVYIDNVNQGFELNNSAASTAVGVDGPIEVRWGFTVSDEWQGIAASLRPLTIQPGT